MDKNKPKELRQIVKPWLEKLQPYGDRGYNKPAKE